MASCVLVIFDGNLPFMQKLILRKNSKILFRRPTFFQFSATARRECADAYRTKLFHAFWGADRPKTHFSLQINILVKFMEFSYFPHFDQKGRGIAEIKKITRFHNFPQTLRKPVEYYAPWEPKLWNSCNSAIVHKKGTWAPGPMKTKLILRFSGAEMVEFL